MEMKSMAATNEKVSNYIPDEISFSILSKLPLKSLKRFECVQKSWSLLFENHHFMNMFRNNFLSYHVPSSLILGAVENYKKVYYSFSGVRFENKVKLDWSNSYRYHIYTRVFGFGNVNGTFCLYTGHNGNIVLWNPTTQTIMPLPHSEVELVQLYMPHGANDYVDFNVDYYVHGFGYDHVINDYNVIRYVDIYRELLCEYPEDESSILLDWLVSTDIDPLWEIYSLRSNSWRKLHVDMPHSSQCYECTQVYMDGVCHWLCEYHETVGPCLVSFYLRNEVFFITPIPSCVDDCFYSETSWINLAVLNESTALISYHMETTTFHISILGEIGLEESWTKLLIVGPLSFVMRPIGVGVKGEIIFIRKDEELVWLDLSTQMTAELGYKGGVVHSSQIIIYKESILPIKGISN
ncbi:hypothetical protein TSUD_283910 [Trifolium subterraneum]|uniref:F-box associated beta-propeller type 1 domain-containing protein n=1 Tax=Trifolium subterraneum TaxID=3900 RepID=A0A2Z6NHI5_TRISU|nr:hypothetical protein TSUD_283910 [Trifolium subterraneum]